MIKKINIKKFGLFSNFQWKNKIKDKGNNESYFLKENIIYGRNYSGKTTLSRIVRSLETKTISDKYDTPEFEIELVDEETINQNNYTKNSLKIRVFNEDFVRENLSFIIDPNGQIASFAILGENTDIQSQIDQLINELGSNEKDEETGMYKNLKDFEESRNLKEQEYNTTKRNIDSQLTTKAKEIKQSNSKYGDVNYNYTKIKFDIETIKSGNFISIDSEKEKQNEQIIKEEIKEEIRYSLFEEFRLSQFIEKAKELLLKNILDTNKIEELIKNASLNNWVKIGYDLHKEDKENCKCGFCGHVISQARWAELDKHFDEETEKLKQNLVSFQKEISGEIDRITTLLNKDNFYTEFQNEAENILYDIELEYDKYREDLEYIKSKVKEREVNILQVLHFELEPTFSITNFNNHKQSFLDLVERNNENAQNLSSKQETAKKELRLLEVKRFLEGINYDELLKEISDKEKNYKDEIEKVNNLNAQIVNKEDQLKTLQNHLKDERKGAEKVNLYLNNFFGHQNLTLEAIENEELQKSIKFEVRRNGHIAHHLSEGECSLLAFCYFIAKLDDVETSTYKPIIFIDDPISSLDSNHIFYIYSLINSELFCENRFEQIFISTHNLEFLKYLKKLQKSKNSKREYFIINRNKENTEILLMPDYMKSYVTEFNYLFHQIYKCANASLVDDSNYHIFYNFGNNARKFLEVLLFYKYPSNQGDERKANTYRLKQYFDNDNQVVSLTERINNEYSHLEEIFTRSENIIEGNVEEMNKVAQFILKKIKEKDTEQYNALLESVGVKSTN